MRRAKAQEVVNEYFVRNSHFSDEHVTLEGRLRILKDHRSKKEALVLLIPNSGRFGEGVWKADYCCEAESIYRILMGLEIRHS